MNFGGSSSNQVPTQSTQYVLSPQQQQILDAAMPEINRFASKPLQQYSGPQVVGFNQNQTAGQNAAVGAAGNQATTAGQASGTAAAYLTPGITMPGTNSALQGAIDASTRPIYQNLTESILPQIRSDAIGTGNYGGSRQGIAEGLAIRGANQTAADTAAKIAQNEYDTNVSAQLKAIGLVPTIQQAQVTPATTVSGVGDVQQNQAQQELNSQIQQYYLSQYLPYLQSKDLVSLAAGIPGGGAISTGSVAQPSTLQSIVGGASAAASLLPFLLA